MKLLSGSELADYIKERQAKQVRALRQADHVAPCLTIVVMQNDPVTTTYIGLKQRYGQDILADVRVERIEQADAITTIDHLNHDETVHGIIVQLPLADPSQTQTVLDAVDPAKDVDGLGAQAIYDPATPLAINWLLAGYSINLSQRHILIVGNGRLVGAPLARMWRNSGYQVTVVDDSVSDLAHEVQQADVIVTATGVPGLIMSHMVRPDTVLIDAGTSADAGKIVGDVADDVYARQDVTITPRKGGVGPLTVTALFDNVIRAARATISDTE